MSRYLRLDKKKKTINLFQIIFAVMLTISLIGMLKWFRENKTITKEISEAITTNETNGIFKYSVDFQKLKQKNLNTVAWLKVNGTNIEYIVVKSNNNSYYLNHNFEQKYNEAG